MTDVILYDCASIPKDWSEDLAKRWETIKSLHVNDKAQIEVHVFPVERTSLLRFRDGVCDMLSSGCVEFHGTPEGEDNNVAIGRVLHEVLTRGDDLWMVTVVTSSDATVSTVRYIVAQDNDHFVCPVDVSKVSLYDRSGTICTDKLIRLASLKGS